MGQNKILLITNYWSPWSCPGTMRWLQMGRFIDFDVLTSKKPRGGFYDSTLPKAANRTIYRHGSNLPAILSGVVLTLFAIFSRYDIYVVTVPPFTLSLCAWLLQKMGRKVVLDIRDNQDNKNNHWKLTAKLCGYFRSKIRNRTTSFQFLDEGATRILSGYNSELEVEYGCNDIWALYEMSRLNYRTYISHLLNGFIPDYRKRMSKVYACSSFVNFLYLGFKNLPTDCLHKECIDQPVQSWKESAKQMEEYLDSVIC